MDEGIGDERRSGATLLAVGDVMLGDHPMCIGHGVASVIMKMGPMHVFEKVAPTLRKGDIVFGNLETVLSSKNLNPKSLESVQMRGAPESVEGLKHAGFNILSIANNHILDHGEESMRDTMDILEKNGIRHLGAKDGQTQVLEAKGLKIAFLAHNLVRERIAPENFSTSEQVLESVEDAKEAGDVTVLSIHWGAEYVSKPSPSQIRFARELVDSGADIILGHHSHVFQGVERYGKGLIAYSLGNFVFDTHHGKTRESAILSLESSRDGVIDSKPIPVIINDTYQPEVAQGEKARGIVSRIEKLSSDLEKEDLSDFEKKTEAHEDDVRLNLQQYGKESRKYFIRNVHRYPKGMLPHLFMKSIRRRAGLK